MMIDPIQNKPADDSVETIDIRQYLALLWHWLWLIILVAFFTGLITLIISNQLERIYSATTTVLISEAPSSKNNNDYNSILSSERLTRTYAQMLVKKPILTEVIRRLELGITLEEMTDAITVQPIRDTQLIDITVESSAPLEAALIANTLVGVFSEQLQSMETARYSLSKQNLQTQLADIEKQIQDNNSALAKTDLQAAEKGRLEAKSTQLQQLYSTLLLSYEEVRLAEAQSTSNVISVEQALPVDDPIRPKVLLNTILAIFISTFITIVLIFAIEALDDTLKNPDEVNKLLGLPVLTIIARYPNSEGKLITEAEPRSPVSEAFRTLRTNVQYASVDRPVNIIMVTSPTPAEGKTTITSNLAVVLAQSGQRVTIIDCDMRKPTVHLKFNLRNHIGLSSIFVRPSIILNGMLQKTRIANLSTITSGRLPPNPSELLGSQKMKKILLKVKEENDMILLDTPPALAVTDAAVLVPYVDGVILVMKPGKTRIPIARQTVGQLQRLGANIIGVVLNDVQIKRSKYGYYYYQGYQGYSTYYSDDEK